MGTRDEPRNGRWLASQAVSRPGLIAKVEEVGGSYGGIEVHWGKHDWYGAVQFFEYGARRGTETFALEDYQWASNLVKSSVTGPPIGSDKVVGPLSPSRAGKLAQLLWILGSYADDHRSYRLGWATRYASRPPLAGEEDAGRQVREGHVRVGQRSWAGSDGSQYAPGAQTAPGGGTRPAVVVTNSAGSREVITFEDHGRARSWLANHARGRTGPLATTETGPPCRASHEDELLAYLLHNAYADQPWDLMSQVKWTTHLRAELYAAVAPQGLGRPCLYPGSSPASLFRRFFTERLALAPGWAVDTIGWPGARYAAAYFDRLAATPVTKPQALRAAEELASADAQAAAKAAEVSRSPARPALPAGRRFAASQRPGKVPGRARKPGPLPPPPAPGSTGPVPRMP
jgi:hypothetical protein